MHDIETASRLRRAIVHLARKFNAAAVGENLTPSQASTLALVAIRGPMPLAAIAEEEGLNPTMLSRIIGTLESKGLVERLRAPEDKRAVTVAATPEGARLQERIRDERVGTILDAAALLSPNQRKAINSSLEALEALIKAMP